MSYSYPPEGMREFDCQAAALPGSSFENLLFHAGDAVAEICGKMLREMPPSPRLIVVAGNGNNGGDAMAALLRLLADGILPEERCALVLACPPPACLKPLPAKLFGMLPERIQEEARQLRLPPLRPGENALLLDGLLGTGFPGGALRPEIASLIQSMNESGCPILSIDVPSGLNAGNGPQSPPIVQATATVSFVAIKDGMLSPKGIEHSGVLYLRPLPGQDILDSIPHGCFQLFGEEDARAILPHFSFHCHKFSRGEVLVVGGSVPYAGAPILSGNAALQAGAGIVRIALPQDVFPRGTLPQALILQHLPADATGHFDALAADFLPEIAQRSDALAIGPGLGQGEELPALLQAAIALGKPLVLDADALNTIARMPSLLQQQILQQPIVLTPHPGEFARLLRGFGLENCLSAPREEAATALAAITGCTILLKGARSLVVSYDGELSYNLSGCPALATAGSGDVLTGLVAAFLANGLSAWDAARLAAYLHGRAGEMLSSPHFQHGVLADDLPAAIRNLLRRR